ncbi:MAG TPA: hypothetical protein VFZ34_07795 [Blastocatellia bacterium]|nr:hypothetical protein [Blastocatellia bacterium]
MKKIGFFALASIITVVLMSAPTLANAGFPLPSFQQQPPPLEPQEAADLYGKYFAEKDQAKKYELAKEFLEKYSSVDPYWKKGPQTFVKNYELRQAYDKCDAADKAYFAMGGQNAANLNNLMTACDAYLAKDPNPNIHVSNRLALATGYGVLVGFYKDTDRSNAYAEKSLKLIEPTAPPSKDWPPDTWSKFRTENISRLKQYQGLFKLRQPSADNEAAIRILTEAAAVKDGPAAKDPNTYLLRAEATTALYTKLNAEYNALPDGDKTGDKGKELLSKIYPVVEKMANDYARVVALTEGKPEYKSIYDEAKAQTEQFVKFLNKDYKPEDLYKLFKGDIAAPDAKIKTDESVSSAPPVAPTVKSPKTATVAAAAGGSTATGNGTKTTAKPKAPPKKSKK